MYQEIDPFHNIPKQAIVQKGSGSVKQTGLLIFALVLIAISAFLLWGRWVSDVVPDDYVFDPSAQEPDSDYLYLRRR